MKLIIKLCIVIILILSFFCWRLLEQQNFQWNDTIAVSWGDGKYGKAFYGTYVFLGNNVGGKVEVKARIYLGRRGYFSWYAYELGVIGIANDDVEATKMWGNIKWVPEGVEIGGSDGVKYFVKREYFENHR